MAPSINSSLIVFFVCSLAFHAALGEIICEQLSSNVCSFSIAPSGKRCVLENYENNEGKVEFRCKSSELMVENIDEHIETQECVINSCGVARNSVGISSDAVLGAQTTSTLCSPACYEKCPNIFELYFNLAAGKGQYLQDLCEMVRTNPHRTLLNVLINTAAPGPAHAPAPAPSPSS